MAQRRMFSLSIVDSDAFLEMPHTTQLLYFHLSMRADDDGFISNAKRIMRMVNCQEDDLKLLISKRFVLVFETGIIVIKHWKIHNYIAKDRYKETLYLEEKNKIFIKNNGVYTDCIQKCIQNDDTGKVSIGKVSIDKRGSLKNVELTNIEYNKLIEEYNKSIIEKYIESLSTYIPNKKGKPYKNHNAVIRNWLNKDNIPKYKKIEIPKNSKIDLNEEWI